MTHNCSGFNCKTWRTVKFDRSVLKNAGFSLIELLYVVTIFSILLSIALPAWQRFDDRNHVSRITTEIKQMLYFAKNQSKATNQVLRLGAITQKQDWSHGIVLTIQSVTSNSNNQQNILRQWRFDSRKVSIQWHGFQSNNFILIAPHIQHTTLNGYFIIRGAYHANKLFVNRTGRIREINLS